MKKFLKGAGKFLFRLIIVALGSAILGYVLWFVFGLIGHISTWITARLEGAYDLVIANVVTVIVFVVLATVVWTVAEIITNHMPKGKGK